MTPHPHLASSRHVAVLAAGLLIVPAVPLALAGEEPETIDGTVVHAHSWGARLPSGEDLPLVQERVAPIRGTIRAAESGDPIPGASIRLEPLNQGTSSDTDGRFVINGIPAGTHDLVVSAVGYVSSRTSVVVGETAIEVEVRLEVDPLGIDGLTVTAARSRVATKAETELLATPQAISIVPEAVMKQQAAVTLDAGGEAGGVGDSMASRDSLGDACSPPPEGAPQEARIEHAEGFSLSYHDGYKVLRIHPPADRGGGTDVVVLVQCGRSAPPLSGDLADAHVVQIPVETLAANEDLTLTRARVLGRTEAIVAMGGGGVYAEEIRARWERGDAVEIGASFHGPPRFEVLLETAPDITYLSTASLSDAESLRRARELGLAAVPSVSWVEPTPLAQAEWLHQVAAFFNDEAVARERLEAIESRYRSLADRAAAEDTRPLVLWIDPTGAGDRWVVPADGWRRVAIGDAGGRTLFDDVDGEPTIEVTSEEILARGDSIAFVLTESIALDEPGSAGALESLPAFREGRVFSVHRRSRPEQDAYDWYESAVVEVDRVLEDLVALLHPDLLPGHAFHHLRPARASAH